MIIQMIRISVKAQIEINQGWLWYEGEQPGLGTRFEDEVYKKIEFIRDNPEIYPNKNLYKEAVINGFPFIIVYKINKRKKSLFIVSVFHTSRHPKRKLR
jgi:plasmid stabilization system protein ParE